MSLVGYICFKMNIDLTKLRLVLLFALFGLIIGMLFSSPNNRGIFIFGFILFSIFIAVDTYDMIHTKKKSVIDDALSLYLDILNLFQQLLGMQSTK
jgi:FtsH-binding integral membrane protein